MNVLVTVPTYWRAPADPSGMYDHPTPLGKQSTLPRLLDSLVRCAADVPIVVIVGGTDLRIAEAAEEEVRSMVDPYRRELPIAVFGPADLRFLASRISSLGGADAAVGLVGYGRIRNLQLILGVLTGADAVVGLDDDEELPPRYFSRVRGLIAGEYAGGPVLGVVGPYQELSVAPAARSENPFLERGRWIRRCVDSLASAPAGQLVETPIGFGGNIVIRRELFMRVPFDPNIPRGEDVDYITGCRMHGDRFWWDNELFVYHFPPVRFRRPACVMLRADAMRFLYSREKIAVALRRGWQPPGDLDFYPGRFLRRDFPALVRDALTKACPGEFGTEAKAERFVAETTEWARAAVDGFFRVEVEWDSLTAALATDAAAVEYVRKKIEGGRR